MDLNWVGINTLVFCSRNEVDEAHAVVVYDDIFKKDIVRNYGNDLTYVSEGRASEMKYFFTYVEDRYKRTVLAN